MGSDFEKMRKIEFFVEMSNFWQKSWLIHVKFDKRAVFKRKNQKARGVNFSLSRILKADPERVKRL